MAQPGYTKWDAGQHDTLGNAAYVLAILAICTFPVLGGLIFGPGAMLFGILGRERAERGLADNGAKSNRAIVLGKWAFVVSLVCTLVEILVIVLVS